ncbi:TIGR03087 family PEP-CTERM/XrtA system glycosyltransferase [Candidatus Thiodictyon syntrophicum]|jgi:sugar transferase (PEP-CTERM/EpsH1 system associated)|uniref:Sugar transferase n=1 Tax=Candidatus Thiodictyon syntrophicum TaxID=1166950 RepID=A0A2K8UCB6_9GAMM|nr:TIGR03087 family PEP-CTERM/XrtA system glycosyltransferase [Candidatus Thiodictyon syntrophicum]AUB83206.1 hypothetical protein THSYN_21180 [Candidatus Thiodictyon syntrophicum]
MVDARPHLLFLCHRIPYPPEKGDKIRSYHWWAALVERFRVHLGAFIDDPADWVHVEKLQAQCASSLFVPLPRSLASLRSLSGLWRGTALTLPYYRDARMTRWVEAQRTTSDIGYVLVFSSAMGQYVQGGCWSRARRVMDFVDLDSDKWQQYVQTRPWPTNWVYRREALRLAQAEEGLARTFAASLFVSEPEAALFRKRVAALGARVHAIRNGVDTAYFRPAAGCASPFPVDCEPVVFTGAMDYWANVDAVLWFIREVWPRVRAQRPRALFAIVGSRPSPALVALGCGDIVVTGRVPDVRPYLQAAVAVVAPMRVARGIQNKVLEGMAMAKPVVVTSKALEGIAAVAQRDLLLADEPGAFADAVLAVLGAGDEGLGSRARRLVEREYDWAVSTQQLIALLLGRDRVAPA